MAGDPCLGSVRGVLKGHRWVSTRRRRCSCPCDRKVHSGAPQEPLLPWHAGGNRLPLRDTGDTWCALVGRHSTVPVAPSLGSSGTFLPVKGSASPWLRSRTPR